MIPFPMIGDVTSRSGKFLTDEERADSIRREIKWHEVESKAGQLRAQIKTHYERMGGKNRIRGCVFRRDALTSTY